MTNYGGVVFLVLKEKNMAIHHEDGKDAKGRRKKEASRKHFTGERTPGSNVLNGVYLPR